MKHTVSEHHLEGGAAGLVIDVPGSDVVSLQVRFNSGFQFADPMAYEVPHVMEHVLATVTQKHPGPNEFIIDAQKNGAYVNASTSVDANGYIYECADFELERILDLVEEQLAEPLFAQKPLTAELGNVREELSRNTTQHATVCSVRLAEKTFPHLWLDYEARIAQLGDITPGQVENHYIRTHTSANARFVIAGSFPDGGAKLAKRLGRVFGRLPAGERFVRSQEVGLGLDRPVVTERDIAQLYYRVVMYFGELTEGERRAMTLLRLVLVGGMGSRILGEARRRGLAYGVGGAGHSEPGNSSFGFLGYVTPTNAVELYRLMARQFVAVREGDLKAAELEAAKDLLIGSLKRSTQTPGDILGWYLDPYDEAGEIRDFGHTMNLLRDVRLDEVEAVAAKATAGGRRGMSFLGKVTDAQANKYAELLEPLWADV
jgi:predicted Zn-dependent peptidase